MPEIKRQLYADDVPEWNNQQWIDYVGEAELGSWRIKIGMRTMEVVVSLACLEERMGRPVKESGCHQIGGDLFVLEFQAIMLLFLSGKTTEVAEIRQVALDGRGKAVAVLNDQLNEEMAEIGRLNDRTVQAIERIQRILPPAAALN